MHFIKKIEVFYFSKINLIFLAPRNYFAEYFRLGLKSFGRKLFGLSRSRYRVKYIYCKSESHKMFTVFDFKPRDLRAMNDFRIDGFGSSHTLPGLTYTTCETFPGNISRFKTRVIGKRLYIVSNHCVRTFKGDTHAVLDISYII